MLDRARERAGVTRASLRVTRWPAKARDMSASDGEPPPSESGPSLQKRNDPLRDSAGRLGAIDEGNDEGDGPASETRERLALRDPPKPLAAEVIRNFLAQAERTGLLKRLVAPRAPPEHVDDLAHDTFAEALMAMTTSPPQKEDALQAWLATIARRTVANFHTKRARREKYEAPMPVEAADATGDASDDDRPDGSREPSYDPRTADDETYPWLARRWLEKQVENNPRDKETLAILLEHAHGGKTYEDIAAAHGMTLTAVSARIFEFKGKYLPRYKRWRNRAVLLVLLGGIIVVAAVAILVMWLFAGRAELVEPARPEAPLVAPPPSVLPPQEPQPEMFNQSQPTRPKLEGKRAPK